VQDTHDFNYVAQYSIVEDVALNGANATAGKDLRLARANLRKVGQCRDRPQESSLVSIALIFAHCCRVYARISMKSARASGDTMTVLLGDDIRVGALPASESLFGFPSHLFDQLGGKGNTFAPVELVEP
jgi:hypothetical protein